MNRRDMLTAAGVLGFAGVAGCLDRGEDPVQYVPIERTVLARDSDQSPPRQVTVIARVERKGGDIGYTGSTWSPLFDDSRNRRDTEELPDTLSDIDVPESGEPLTISGDFHDWMRSQFDGIRYTVHVCRQTEEQNDCRSLLLDRSMFNEFSVEDAVLVDRSGDRGSEEIVDIEHGEGRY